MSLSSILQQVNKKGQVQRAASKPSPLSNTSQTLRQQPQSVPQRTVDPVVAMLKEKRRLEKEKKEKEMREKKGLPPKKTPKQTKQLSKSTEKTQKPSTSSSKPPVTSNTPLRKPSAPKMNFNDLMKRASKIDQSKLSILLKKSNSAPPENAKNERSIKERTPRATLASDKLKIKSNKPSGSRLHLEAPKSRTEPNGTLPPVNKARARNPLPIRAPSEALQNKLKAKGKKTTTGVLRKSLYRDEEDEDQYSEESDEELDDFVVSDEEEEAQAPQDYDRDEIWAIFNKGRKRTYHDYDDDSDDMEATGADIFEEEMRSRRVAELEDRREAEEEKRRAEMKKRRLGKS